MVHLPINFTGVSIYELLPCGILLLSDLSCAWIELMGMAKLLRRVERNGNMFGTATDFPNNPRRLGHPGMS